MNLGEKEYKFLIKLIIAYLRKKEKRQKYDKEEKKDYFLNKKINAIYVNEK
ncbi:MAG: hypothetical protein ACLU4S_11205 [Clostridium perfringens]